MPAPDHLEIRGEALAAQLEHRLTGVSDVVSIARNECSDHLVFRLHVAEGDDEAGETSSSIAVGVRAGGGCTFRNQHDRLGSVPSGQDHYAVRLSIPQDIEVNDDRRPGRGSRLRVRVARRANVAIEVEDRRNSPSRGIGRMSRPIMIRVSDRWMDCQNGGTKDSGQQECREGPHGVGPLSRSPQ